MLVDKCTAGFGCSHTIGLAQDHASRSGIVVPFWDPFWNENAGAIFSNGRFVKGSIRSECCCYSLSH